MLFPGVFFSPIAFVSPNHNPMFILTVDDGHKYWARPLPKRFVLGPRNLFAYFADFVALIAGHVSLA